MRPIFLFIFLIPIVLNAQNNADELADIVAFESSVASKKINFKANMNTAN